MLDFRNKIKTPKIIKFIPVLIAILGIISIFFWLRVKPGIEMNLRLPGADGAGDQEEAVQVAQAVGDISSGKLVKSDGVASDIPGEWPRFRGKDFDNINKENIKLAKKWAGAPKAIWGIDVGEGYAGAAIFAGRVYVMDYDQAQEADALRCLSLADGKEIWRYTYPVQIKRNHGMSRPIPTVTDKYIVAMGPMCHVICLNPISGELFWAMDLVKDYGATVPEWYTGQCPIIDGEKAIIAPGGDALIMAVECANGNILWKTPNMHNWKMTHSSVMPMEYEGKKMYIYCASGGVVGVSADDGSILWETTEWKISIATVPSPLVIGDGKIFFSGGYNVGSMMVQLKKDGNGFSVETLFRLKPNVFGATQQTPILYNGYIYGVRPDEQLVCLTVKGEPVWASGNANRFGLGPFMIAGGMIYVMNDDGLLTLVDASPDGYKQLAQAQVLNGHDAWGPMAMAGGRLILRDLTRMFCLDVSGY